MSCSSSDTQWIHDVFLNFRQDTRKTFVSHLYAGLTNAGINTFIDDNIPKGTELGAELVRAIQGSRISIVVFSPKYTSSRWCLDELVKIMECHRTYGQLVVPVFYDIEPSVVRHQRGTFGESLETLSNKCLLQERLKSWKSALYEAGNFAGWDARAFSGGDLVERIVDSIFGRLDNDLLPIPEFPVGLESRAQQVVQIIEDQPSTCFVVGIWGMGGLGKTTMAKVIYNQIRQRFTRRSFIENIREVCEKDSRGCIELQEQLLTDLLVKTKNKIRSISMGITMIEKRLCKKKALIALDDVTEIEQFRALCGNCKQMALGSVIIITTRDVRLLNVLKVDHMVHIFRIKEMDENESLELFSWHAFRQVVPKEDFTKLAKDVVTYCRGLPLALEVLGSYLFERTKEEWESALTKLKEIPNDRVQEKLKISYNSLDSKEKNIFLDICFFFIGKDRADVTEILKGCGLHPEIGITVLIERSLIKLDKNNKLKMHDLLRDMGREIVRQSSAEEPEKRSRLWVHQEVVDVLSNHTGTKAIEGLALKLQRTSQLQFNTKAFKEMKKLRLLQLFHVQLDGDYEYLNKNLRWICWQGFPLKHIPENLCQENVISIELKYSNIRLVWKEPKFLQRLKILNLSHSRSLIHTPDFSKLPNLAKLILKDCPSLSEVHQSIGDLGNLCEINLMDCTSLNNLPRTIYQLKSLKTLILSGCSKIDKLEEDMEQMESLTTLIAKDTAVKEIPHSIARLKSIGYISLCGHEGLARDVFPSLIWSWMSPTMNDLSHIHSLSGTSSTLVSMNMQSNNLGDLVAPMFSSLSNLRSVLVQCDTKIQLSKEFRTILDDLKGASFTELQVASYTPQFSKHSLRSYLIGIGIFQEVFNILSSSISEGLATSESSEVFLPGTNDPYWFAHTGEGNSVYFTVPADCHLKGMALCVIYSLTPENMASECLISVLVVNYTKCTIQIHKPDTIIFFNDEDWQGIISHLGAGDKVEIFVTFGNELVIKKTAVYLMCDESIEKEMESTPEAKKEPKENAYVRFAKKNLFVAFGLFLFFSLRSLTTKKRSLSHS